MNVIVRTREGHNLPRCKPRGFRPSEGDLVFLWAIEEGYGGDGLAQRGEIYSFRSDEKAFRFRIRNDERPMRALRSRDLRFWAPQSGAEATLKVKINEYRPPTVLELTEEEAIYLDQFYRAVHTQPRNEGTLDTAGLTDLASDLDTVRNDPTVGETTRAQLTQARLGQGEFREALLRRWQRACAATGCDQPEVLRASHVRPWVASSNEQRLNPANGILLTANLDALFDRFLISFEDDGRMLISDRVARSCRELLGIPARLRGGLTAEEKDFLAFHRETFRGCAAA